MIKIKYNKFVTKQKIKKLYVHILHYEWVTRTHTHTSEIITYIVFTKPLQNNITIMVMLYLNVYIYYAISYHVHILSYILSCTYIMLYATPLTHISSTYPNLEAISYTFFSREATSYCRERDLEDNITTTRLSKYGVFNFSKFEPFHFFISKNR